jgi:hypothetical protein
MKTMTHWLALAGLATLCLGVGNLTAQEQPAPGGSGGDRGDRGGRGDRGNFDPAQFRQQMEERMMQSTRDRLEITDDTEWKAIEPLVKKVNELRMQQAAGGMRGMFGRGGRGPGGDQGGRSGFGGEASAEQTALADAIEQNASKDDLKAKMAAFRKAREAKESELKAAQETLKKVLTTKQEAVALQMGLVN